MHKSSECDIIKYDTFNAYITLYGETDAVILSRLDCTNMLKCQYRFNILKHQCFIIEIIMVLSFHHVCSLSLVSLIL
jgi:hypothetical protein